MFDIFQKLLSMEAGNQKEDLAPFFTNLKQYNTVTQLSKNISVERVVEVFKRIDDYTKNIASYKNIKYTGWYNSHVVDIFKEGDELECSWPEEEVGFEREELTEEQVACVFDAYLFLKLKESGYIKTKSFSFSSSLNEVKRKLLFILKSKCNNSILDTNQIGSIRFAGEFVVIDFKSIGVRNYNINKNIFLETLISLCTFLVDNNIENVYHERRDNTLKIKFDVKDLLDMVSCFYSVESSFSDTENIANEILSQIEIFRNTINLCINACANITEITENEFCKFEYLKYSADAIFSIYGTDTSSSNKINQLYLFSDEKVTSPLEYKRYLDSININLHDIVSGTRDSSYIKALTTAFNNQPYNNYGWGYQGILTWVINEFVFILNRGYELNLLPGMINFNPDFNVCSIFDKKFFKDSRLIEVDKNIDDRWLERTTYLVVNGEKTKVELNASR